MTADAILCAYPGCGRTKDHFYHSCASPQNHFGGVTCHDFVQIGLLTALAERVTALEGQRGFEREASVAADNRLGYEVELIKRRLDAIEKRKEHCCPDCQCHEKYTPPPAPKAKRQHRECNGGVWGYWHPVGSYRLSCSGTAKEFCCVDDNGDEWTPDSIDEYRDAPAPPSETWLLHRTSASMPWWVCQYDMCQHDLEGVTVQRLQPGEGK